MSRNSLMVTFSVLIAPALATLAHGQLITNGDFSTAFTIDDGANNITLQTGPTGRWVRDADSSLSDWINAGGLTGAATLGAEDPEDSRNRALLQTVMDSQTTMGAAQLNFSLNITDLNGTSDEDLFLYVLGWNAGDASPVVDLSNAEGTVGASVAANDGVSLLTGADFRIIENGMVNAALLGVDQDGVFDPVSLDLDFGLVGFDYFSVIFEGEAGNGDPLFQIDDISITQDSANSVPEPTSIAIWSVLSLGLIAFGIGRARRSCATAE